MNLKRGEAKRTSTYAVKGTVRTDVWEGIYLNEEKVAIKVIRAVYASPTTLKVYILIYCCESSINFMCRGSRQKRKFGEGCTKPTKENTPFRYTVFVKSMGIFRESFIPVFVFLFLIMSSYIVSPWVLNGTLIEYINEYPEVDHRYLVHFLFIEGIQYSDFVVETYG